MTATVVRFSDVEREPLSWLWRGYWPLGKLVVVEGDPGIAKTTVVLDVGARVSTGRPMPDDSPCGAPGAVLILSAEDGLGDTLRPRLDAAGADVTNVFAMTEISFVNEEGDRSTRPVSLPGDLAAVEAAVVEHGIRLVVVDVLMAYLSGGVDAHRDQDIRRVMHLLSELADRCGACIVLIRHLNKAAGGSPMYRGGGSIGIIGAARAGFVIAADPDDESKRVMASVKANLAPAPPSLSYRLVSDERYGVARVEWLGVSTQSAAGILASPIDHGPRNEARDFLLDLLDNGPVPANDVKAAAREAALSWATVRRAADGLKVERRKVGRPGEAGQQWVWQLPEDAEGVQHETVSIFGESEHLRDLPNSEGAHRTPEDAEGAHVLGVSTYPRCTACTFPLDPAIVATGEDTHPGCAA